jgi:hypothetical protein
MVVTIRQKIHLLKSRKSNSHDWIEGQASNPFVMGGYHGGINERSCEKRYVLGILVVQFL